MLQPNLTNLYLRYASITHFCQGIGSLVEYAADWRALVSFPKSGDDQPEYRNALHVLW